jgi:hypothetical protein
VFTFARVAANTAAPPVGSRLPSTFFEAAVVVAHPIAPGSILFTLSLNMSFEYKLTAGSAHEEHHNVFIILVNFNPYHEILDPRHTHCT